MEVRKNEKESHHPDINQSFSSFVCVCVPLGAGQDVHVALLGSGRADSAHQPVELAKDFNSPVDSGKQKKLYITM